MRGAILRKMIAEGRITDPATSRGRLLAAGARLFCLKGYDSTTVRDIAAEVGILSGSIFHHFKSKEEILFGVMLEASISMTEALKFTLARTTGTRDKFRALIWNELSFIHGKTGSAVAVLVYEWRSLSEKSQKAVLAERAKYDDLWMEILIQAREEGLITIEPEIIHHLIHGAIVWSTKWFHLDGELTLEDLVDRIVILAMDKN